MADAHVCAVTESEVPVGTGVDVERVRFGIASSSRLPDEKHTINRSPFLISWPRSSVSRGAASATTPSSDQSTKPLAGADSASRLMLRSDA